MSAEHRSSIVEFEVVGGLGPLLRDELVKLHRGRLSFVDQTPRALRTSGTDARVALRSRLASAAFSVTPFRIPRPRALLGEENLATLVADIGACLALHPANTFASFRISAAGSDSAVFERLGQELSRRIGLPRSGDGDLLLRVRPAAEGTWETLVSLSPKPLWARPWHVQGAPGSLDPTIAAAMVELTRPAASDVFFDPTCGTGTLLMERLAAGRCRAVLGGDRGADALAAAEDNLVRSGWTRRARLVRGDAAHMPVGRGAVGAMAVNLPWGHRFGTPAENEELYPAFLSEAARVARTGTRLVVLTHDLRRFARHVGRQSIWEVHQEIQIELGGHHPKIWVLSRGGGAGSAEPRASSSD